MIFVGFFRTDEARLAGERVLVHCHAGVSRSATIVIAYIMKHTQLNMHDAYTFVKDRRTIISPNFNFLGQLHLFEQDLVAGRVQRDILPHLLRPISAAAMATELPTEATAGDTVNPSAPKETDNLCERTTCVTQSSS